ncbi:hypothetical protein B6U66_03735 [Candidatus Bathyarchaeota archaeon ex4484_135]|nr:MAG: hypothetical protein B6U66_03735 [Candidatus Bathyarchaeota archaeon ex4484_135]
MASRAVIVVAVLLFLAAGVGIWYAGLGGKEFIEKTLFGQEAVAVELSFTYKPVASSPLRDIEVYLSVTAKRIKVGPDVEFKKPIVREGHEDKIRSAAPGAEVYFKKTILIYDEEGNLLFNRTMEFTKGTDRTITIYISAGEVKGDKLLVVVDIYIRVELPKPEGAPGPSVIEVTVHREVETNIVRE